MATLVGDQDDSSESEEDIKELDNDPEVITESPEGDESDVIENQRVLSRGLGRLE